MHLLCLVLRHGIRVLAAFVLLIGAARAFGGVQPAPEALAALHLTDCTLPCWLGITPGETTYAETIQRMSAVYAPAASTIPSAIAAIATFYQNGALHGRVIISADQRGLVGQIFLDTHDVSGISLGDVVALLGLPACVISSVPASIYYGSSATTLALVAAGDAVEQGWRQALQFVAVQRERNPCQTIAPKQKFLCAFLWCQVEDR